MAGADLFEIRRVPYTKADLDWMDKKSRKHGGDERSVLASAIWTGRAYGAVTPSMWDSRSGGMAARRIINTFLESYDFSGKTVIPFATSGGSGMGKTEAVLHALCPDSVNWKSGKMLNGYDRAQMEAWVRTLA